MSGYYVVYVFDEDPHGDMVLVNVLITKDKREIERINRDFKEYMLSVYKLEELIKIYGSKTIRITYGDDELHVYGY